MREISNRLCNFYDQILHSRWKMLQMICACLSTCCDARAYKAWIQVLLQGYSASIIGDMNSKAFAILTQM